MHEAWEKLSRSNSQYNDRSHFVSTAVRAMRQILVDYARAQRTAKRGAGRRQTTLTGLASSEVTVDLVILDQALQELEREDPQSAAVVLHRTFGGLTIAETAEILQVSERLVSSRWRFARAWLAEHLELQAP